MFEKTKINEKEAEDGPLLKGLMTNEVAIAGAPLLSRICMDPGKEKVEGVKGVVEKGIFIRIFYKIWANPGL